MALSDYLAQRYLNASNVSDPRTSRKRKRKDPKRAGEGLIIADDDVPISSLGIDQDAADDDGPVAFTSGEFSQFRKSKTSAWKAVGSANAPGPKTMDDADVLLLAAAREDEEQRQLAEEGEKPTILSAAEASPQAGLQTGEQVAAQIAAKRKAEMAAFAAEDPRKVGRGQQTIYRDASGRIVDVAMKRAEARKKAEEDDRRTRELERETLEGKTQVAKREERKRELDEVALHGVARTKDDLTMNQELKSRTRWGDPMAGMVLEDDEGGGGQVIESGQAKSIGLKGKAYRGAYEPNRYGIPPGHRWDGVDRGNGFERKWFESRNLKKKNEERDYAWQMDE